MCTYTLSTLFTTVVVQNGKFILSYREMAAIRLNYEATWAKGCFCFFIFQHYD